MQLLFRTLVYCDLLGERAVRPARLLPIRLNISKQTTASSFRACEAQAVLMWRLTLRLATVELVEMLSFIHMTPCCLCQTNCVWILLNCWFVFRMPSDQLSDSYVDLRKSFKNSCGMLMTPSSATECLDDSSKNIYFPLNCLTGNQKENVDRVLKNKFKVTSIFARAYDML